MEAGGTITKGRNSSKPLNASQITPFPPSSHNLPNPPHLPDKSGGKPSYPDNTAKAQIPAERQEQVAQSIPLSKENISRINQTILEVNRLQKIYNLDKFDLTASESTIVIVVQVHNRDEYLHYLIDSLRKARHIEQTLLVFSHDYYSEEINKIVRAIDFCPVRSDHRINYQKFFNRRYTRYLDFIFHRGSKYLKALIQENKCFISTIN